MIYSDKIMLLADDETELHCTAKLLNLTILAFKNHPFPHYFLDNHAIQQLQKQGLKFASTPEMLLKYFGRKPQL